ncbi:hypothetical protein HDU76_000104 [Blyttiomyces sp. JEL0837]|nr:hypothetical protein HDU76_000104 [Blyttiomyces sp. JEL0837]
MSADLVWALTRDNSSFLVKRNGIQLSREPGNLLNKNSFKYSGVNAKAVDVSAAAQKGVTVTLNKKSVPANKPAKHHAVATITRGGNRSILKSVRNMVNGYRSDLTGAALARVTRILETQKGGKVQKAKKLRGKKAAQ